MIEYALLKTRKSASTASYSTEVLVHISQLVIGLLIGADGEWIQSIIDDKLYLTAPDWYESVDEEKRTWQMVNSSLEVEEKYRNATQTGSRALYFAQCSSENETWLPLMEKAFAKAHGDFSSIDGGFNGSVCTEPRVRGFTNEHKAKQLKTLPAV